VDDAAPARHKPEQLRPQAWPREAMRQLPRAAPHAWPQLPLQRLAASARVAGGEPKLSNAKPSNAQRAA